MLLAQIGETFQHSNVVKRNALRKPSYSDIAKEKYIRSGNSVIDTLTPKEIEIR